jgi:murein DD-endopeptidase MepM/ murein hydrolase activator NlpD
MWPKRKVIAGVVASQCALLAVATTLAVSTRVADVSAATCSAVLPLPTPSLPPPPPPPTLPLPTLPLPTLPPPPTPPPLPTLPPPPPTLPPLPTPLPTLPVVLPTPLPTPLPCLPPLPTPLPTLPGVLPTPLPTLPVGLPTPLPTLPGGSPTPLPTPSPIDLPTLPPILPPGLSPSPSPGGTNNGPGVTVTPPSNNNGGGSSSGGINPSGSTPPSSGNLGPPPAPVPAAAIVALNSVDPTLAGWVADISSHPVTAEQPGLRHFEPAAATQPGGGGIGARIREAVRNPSIVAALVAAVVAAIAAGIAMNRGWGPAWLAALRRRLSRSVLGRRISTRLGPIPLAVLLIPAATASLAAPLAILDARASATAITTPVRVDPAMLAIRSGNFQSAAPKASLQTSSTATPAWTGLLTIEKRIAADRQQLNTLEASVSALSRAAAAPNSRDSSAPLGPTTAATLQQQLHNTIATHISLESSYHAALQDEYAFFRSAAADPARRDQLISAAQVSPTDTRDAVVYNLRVIETQLTQESAIQQVAAAAAAPAATSLQTLVVQGSAGKFSTPMWGSVAQGFGPTSFGMESPMTYHGRFYPHFHTGIDIAAPMGTPVQAAANGIVLLAASSVDGAGNFVGYGRYVVIQHADGVITVYAHLAQLDVSRGQQVSAGQVIGREGSTGWSTGPHLHFEVHRNGDFVDPLLALLGRA